MEPLADKAATLHSLLTGPRMLVLPNAWDAASARAFADAGFPAIATTSGGVAATLGYQDHEDAPADEMLAAAARITRSVSVPVTVDLEAGYGLPPELLAQRAVAAGAAGINLEDTNHQQEVLIDAERLAAFKAAALAAGVDLVLNARVDVFIKRIGTAEQQLTEGIRRGKLYRAAGADCLYPIGLADEHQISPFVDGVGCPVNIMVRRGGVPLSRLAALGVRRASYATSLFREIHTLVEELAREVQTTVANELSTA
jgi:2-methylisocitrate lyase-like PEP mutase family enzyme